MTSIYSESNTYTFPVFNMFIIIHKTIDSIAEITRSRLLIFLMKSLPRNQLRHCNIPPNHRPACSSISQHTATPELGMIPPRIRVNAGLHIARDTISQTNTTGFTRPSTIGQASTVRRPTTAYRSNTIPS